jgi:glycosyltransferase involved in cell wall biosynthesis
MNSKVKYSVIIPTRNREALLIDSLMSILGQQYFDYEIIVADNSDIHVDLSDVLNDPAANGHIKYYRTGGLTMAENWNFAISKASGLWYIIIADKTILKLNTFTCMDALIESNPECNVFTYEYDEYFDKENLFRSRMFGENRKRVSVGYLEKLLLTGRFVEFGHLSGRAYNSIVKGELVRSVISEFGKICIPHNPDYTFCYHLMNRTEEFMYIEPAPIIVRFRSLTGEDPYGNGGNYAKKGRLFLEWSAREEAIAGERFCNFVPIKGWLIHSILLNDFLHVVSFYRKVPSFSKLEYYALNFKDTCYRRSIGADVQAELTAWASAVREEAFLLRITVQLWIIKQRIKNILYPFYRSAISNFIKSHLSSVLPWKRKMSPLVGFNDIHDCFKKVPLNL